MIRSFLFLIFFLFSSLTRASVIDFTLKNAEKRALDNSQSLKALNLDAEAAAEHADWQFSYLLPRLSLDGTYQYNTHVPTMNIPIPGAAGIPFGDHNNYSFGPTLSYTLWDTGSTRNAYRGFNLLAQSKKEEAKNGALQILLAVRSAYLRVQLALEELRLLNSSLSLSRAQNHDIEANYRAGAATRLDQVDSQRDVINYSLQFEQKQAELAADLKDLLTLLQLPLSEGLSRPGPAGIPNVSLELKLDSIEDTLSAVSSWTFSPPKPDQPSLKSQALRADSLDKTAEGHQNTLYPTLQVSASARYQYPDMANLETAQQNSFMVSLSMPLFEWDRTRHLVAEARREADAARFNLDQSRLNLERDYSKATELLESLRGQQKLAKEDVEHSEEAAKLYYRSYRGGKLNLIDVQSANNRALVSKVNAARVDAQILNQLFLLRSISGETLSHAQ